MKKKTLVILLIIPFVIALLTFVSVVALTNNVGVDPRIIWNYRENEGFKTNGEYKLEATLEYDIKAPISEALKSSIASDIAKLQESIQDIHQMIVKLEEASENNSFPSMLSELEKVAMILSPSFLSRMDTEYSVKLVMCRYCCSASFSNLLNTRRSSQRGCL